MIISITAAAAVPFEVLHWAFRYKKMGEKRLKLATIFFL